MQEISYWERGGLRTSSVDRLEWFARDFSTTPEWLAYGLDRMMFRVTRLHPTEAAAN